MFTCRKYAERHAHQEFEVELMKSLRCHRSLRSAPAYDYLCPSPYMPHIWSIYDHIWSIYGHIRTQQSSNVGPSVIATGQIWISTRGIPCLTWIHLEILHLLGSTVCQTAPIWPYMDHIWPYMVHICPYTGYM